MWYCVYIIDIDLKNDNCIGCGKCVMACGAESIRLDIADPVFVNNSIARISYN